MASGPQTSAVALLDVLGFKGREASDDPSTVSEALAAARNAIGHVSRVISENLGPESKPKFTSSCSWFSDTLCMVIRGDEKTCVDSALKAELVRLATIASSTMLMSAAIDDRCPLVFRGVITLGDALVVDDSIYFGSAIAEASALYEMADGAFVWLSPGAATALESPESHLKGKLPRSTVRYRVPLKGGQSVETMVVNPCWIARDRDRINEIRRGFSAAMKGSRLDITIKRQNTIRFLDALELET